MNIVTFWNPVYRVEGVIKFVTAAISVLTAVLLFPLIPQALTLRSAKELEEKNRELEAAYKAVIAHRAKADHERALREEVEQFAYIASHDLKEPLRTIALFTELLKKSSRGKLDPETEGYLGFIVNSASRMNALISDLVSYSLLQSRELKHTAVSLRDGVNRAIENLSVALSEAGAEIVNEVPSDAKVLGVSTQLTQLFQNLIANGVKFQFAGRKPVIRISAVLQEGLWIASIADNGIGFDEKYGDRIFQVFKRLHSSEQTYRGTGMGLAICKRIVDQHGGEIWANSAEGNGSTFFFSIPSA